VKKTDLPAKVPIPFGSGAGAGFITQPIPTASQIGLTPGRASLTDGFVPLNMQPVAAGGIPPFGQDENGILFMATSWDRWLSVGGPVYYDFDFANTSGGYPKEAIIRSRIVVGNLWMSTVDDNVSDPDAFGAGWVSPPFAHATGDVRGNPIPNNTPAGWVPMQSGFTIGAAGSSATYASADAVFLYVKTWNGFSNAQCPVTGGRGANALADFNALKPIQVFDGSASGMIGSDNLTGRLTGVPVISGSPNSPGGVVGEVFHTLSLAEIAAHSHSVIGTSGVENQAHAHGVSGTTSGQSADHSHGMGGVSGSYTRNGTAGPDFAALSPAAGPNTSGVSVDHSHTLNTVSATESAAHNHNINFTSGSAGSNGAHNTIGRSMVVDWLQKL